MKRPWVKKHRRRKIKFGVLLPASSPAFDKFFLNPSKLSPDGPVITSSLNDFTETILQKSFETLQFIWATLKGLMGSQAGGAFNTFFKTIKDQPLVLASIILLIAGLSLAVVRYRKIKTERKQMLEDLKKSLEEDEYEEEEQPLSPSPGTSEEGLDNGEAKPLLSDERAKYEKTLTIENDDSFITDSTLTAEPYESEDVSEPDHKQDDALKAQEQEPAVDSPDEAVKDEKILQKLEEEFVRLENEFQDVDTPREEAGEEIPAKENSSKLASSLDHEQDSDAGADEYDPLAVMEKEILENEETPITVPEEDGEPEEAEEMDDSLVDFQEDMEQTIQELSEQFIEENEETLADHPAMEELAKTDPLTAEQEPFELAVDQEPSATVHNEKIEKTLPPALPPQEETAADDLQLTVEREPEPSIEKKPRLDPKKTHRKINHLVNFQKNLEKQLQKMQIPPPGKEAETVPEKEELPEGFDLQPTEEHYEQNKLTLEKKNSLDLLESFILLDSQKRDD